jgi:hypothetical protein
MQRKALLGAVLQHAAPVSLEGAVLTLALAGNHFHEEMLADRGNRELVTQAAQQHLPGVRRVEVAAAQAAAGARAHPVVQAALEAFQGEVVAVRPRLPEEGDAR